jgi:hypothetical protein
VDGSDAVEVMLADLIVRCHAGAMRAFGLADEAVKRNGHIETYDVCGAQAARYCRAFAELTVALDWRKGRGQQRIVVEHVTVHKGGQAIVGAVNR